jgi:hypothetical protein
MADITRAMWRPFSIDRDGFDGRRSDGAARTLFESLERRVLFSTEAGELIDLAAGSSDPTNPDLIEPQDPSTFVGPIWYPSGSSALVGPVLGSSPTTSPTNPGGSPDSGTTPTTRPASDFRYVLKPGTGWTGPTPQPDPVGNPSAPGYDDKASARWNVGPSQTFDDTIHVGISASHPSGIDRVEFSVNGGDWVAVRRTTDNPQTDVYEYTATLRASSLSEGAAEVRATAYPKVGVPRVLQGSMNAGSADYSLIIQRNAQGILPVPFPAGNVATSVFSAARIDLSWVDNATNESGYRIERSLDGATFSTVTELAPNRTTYSDTGLTPDKRYHYRVRAENGAGYSLSPALDAKTKQNVTLDNDGWTTIVPSSDSRLIYVSSSTGNDSNSGLSPDAPVKTIARGYLNLRKGYPDHLLLKRGDTFNDVFSWAWDKSGRSGTEPMLISAYGTGTRPILATGSSYGLASDKGSSNIAIVGLDIYSSGRDPSVPGYSTATKNGISWLAPTGVQGQNLLIEDCAFRFYGTNISVQGYGGGSWSNVAVRRNVIADAWNLEAAHSQGAFFTYVDGLVLDGNVFDHNGWNESIVGAEPTVFNHNVYITSACNDVAVRNNIFANASSHGIQARSGGDIQNNLFINNPIGMSYGLVNGGSGLKAGGVSGTISGNVFLGGRDIAGSPRGWCIEIANLKSAADGGGTVIRDNVFANDTQGANAAIRLSICDGAQPNFATSPGLNDLTIESNVVYNWYRACYLNPALVPGGTGPQSLNGLVVQNNDFQHLTASTYSAIIHEPAFSTLHERFSGNRYMPALFRLAGVDKTFSQWQSEVEATAQAVEVAYPDPTRDIARYDASSGGAGSVEGFLSTARQQSAQNWNRDYFAVSVINYIRHGFGKQALVQ